MAVVIGIYGYWAGQRQLVSSRPMQPSQYDVADPLASRGVFTLHSRMWEDPLSTAYKHWKQLPQEERGAHPLMVPDSEVPPEDVRKMARSAGGKPTKRFGELLAEFVATWLQPHGVRALRDHVKDDLAAMQEQFRNIVDESGKLTTLCLPVFVPGGPYAEDKERRMRIRYAVVTALAEAGYHLKFSRQMSYVVPRVNVRVFRGWQERPIVVPVKLYRPESCPNDVRVARPQILLLWINESELGLRPLLATHRILNAIFSEVTKTDKLDVAIIGPASSDTLSVIVKELDSIKEKKGGKIEEEKGYKLRDHWKIGAYCPLKPLAGSAPMWPRMGSKNPDKPPRPVAIFSPRATKDIKFPVDNDFVKMYRVIGTDADLADSLRQELELRGALPGTVVLITEHDTAYGRAIPGTFAKAFQSSGANFLTFRVLRGIDGQLPASDNELRPEPAPRKSSSQYLAPDLTEIVERLPEGRSQYDYLKRLPQRIRDQMESPQTGEVTAIGVVGTDVYDKLLVLRALRPQFPECVFFTTDMEAIYTHPEENANTRNLIVASHFGLSLNDKLQAQTPPFRDSYQTATFLATRLAISNRLCQSCEAQRESEATLREWIADVDNAREKLKGFNDGLKNGQMKENEVPHHPDKVRPNPIVNVVGRNRTLRLAATGVADRGGKDKDLDDVVANLDRKIHPAAVYEPRGWHALAGLAFAVFVIGGGSLFAYRDTLFPAGGGPTSGGSDLASDGKGRGGGGGGSGARGRNKKQDTRNKAANPAPAKTGRAWRKQLANVDNPLFVGFLLSAGALLIVYLVVVSVGKNDVSPFGAYGTRSQDMLYAITGVLATFLFAYLLSQFRSHVADIAAKSSRIGAAAEHTYTTIHSMTIIVLGVVVVYTSVLFVFGIRSWYVGVFAVVGAVVLAATRKLISRDDHAIPPPDVPRRNVWRTLILGSEKPEMVCVWAVRAGVLVTVITFLVDQFLEGPLPGWRPTSISRGLISRVGDRLAIGYALGTVGLLLSAVIYTYFWCWEFAHSAKVVASQPYPQERANDAESRVELLQSIGRLTSVTGRTVPAVMAILLVLALAYHPLLSPAPMPLGLLVLISLWLAVLMGMVLMSKRHFHTVREKAVSELEDTILVRRPVPASVAKRSPNKKSRLPAR